MDSQQQSELVERALRDEVQCCYCGRWKMTPEMIAYSPSGQWRCKWSVDDRSCLGWWPKPLKTARRLKKWVRPGAKRRRSGNL